MPKLFRKRLFFLLFYLIAVFLPAHAAKTRGGVLTGVVLDPKGAPVALAHVFWQAADGKSPHALRTDKQGRFHTATVTAGLYELRAEAGGMWSEWEHNVLVRTGAASNLTLQLARQTPPVTKGPTR